MMMNICRLGIIERVLWWAFLIWSGVGLLVMPWNPGPADVAQLVPEGAGNFVIGFLRNADAVWISLAAANTYFWMIRTDGLGTARVQAVLIFAISGLVEWIGQRTGVPFGPYRYTGNFGPMLGGELPVAIPLAWLIIVVCATALLRCTPLVSHRFLLASGTGVVATLTDLNLEPVAWHVRAYWLWYPDLGAATPSAWPPLQNFLSWFALAFALTAILPGIRKRPAEIGAWKRPLIILGLINLLLAITHAAHWFRN